MKRIRIFGKIVKIDCHCDRPNFVTQPVKLGHNSAGFYAQCDNCKSGYAREIKTGKLTVWEIGKGNWELGRGKNLISF